MYLIHINTKKKKYIQKNIFFNFCVNYFLWIVFIYQNKSIN